MVGPVSAVPIWSGGGPVGPERAGGVWVGPERAGGVWVGPERAGGAVARGGAGGGISAGRAGGSMAAGRVGGSMAVGRFGGWIAGRCRWVVGVVPENRSRKGESMSPWSVTPEARGGGTGWCGEVGVAAGPAAVRPARGPRVADGVWKTATAPWLGLVTSSVSAASSTSGSR
ncbi:hypothetical protein [Solwaraspora sp. WMMA2101]|uniref:hypothetical protein n=1 Tax=Solwaraspora sp. WMMA2101 TaxID=3404124 RepID=UPI003B93287C